MDRGTQRTDLADFLRTRRARLSPEEVGLPAGVRRRTPGLRREEVALLADVGITLYTFLEQGRPIAVSAEALGAVARALQLDIAETAHLFALAGRPSPDPGQEEVPANVRAMIEGLGPNPAYIVDACWDILAWNEAETALVPAMAEMHPEERNALWLFFGRPERTWIVGWERHAREALSHFRLDYGRRRGDPRFAAVIERCRRASPSSAHGGHATTWRTDGRCGLTTCIPTPAHSPSRTRGLITGYPCASSLPRRWLARAQPNEWED